jgi:hypothetical protein
MMTPPMRLLGVSAWIYGDAPLDETLGRIATAGYEPIKDAASPAILDGYLVESLARLRAHGLGVPPGVLAG